MEVKGFFSASMLYCDQYYWVDSYKRTYAPEFNPLLGLDDYEKTAKKEMIKPPVYIRKPGRPRGKRIRAHDEPPPIGKKTRKCKRCGLSGHYEKTYAGGAVGSNPKVPKDRTCVDGDTYTTYESAPSKRNKKAAKVFHGSFAGQSTSVRVGSKTKSNSQSIVGESSKQAAARSEKGVKGKAITKAGYTQTNCLNQNFKKVGSVTNNVTFTVSDPKGKKKTKKYMKI